MNLQRSLVVLAACAVLAVPAAAGITAGVDQTFGSNSYRGTKADVSVDLGSHLYLEPTFSTYRDNFSSGSYYNAGLRVGYDFGPISLGVVGAVVPKHDGYSNGSFGADATFSLSPGGTSHSHRMAGPASQGNGTFGYGMAGVDIGVSAVRVMHYDDYKAAGTAGESLRQAGAKRASTFNLGETDLSVFAGAKFLLVEASAEATKSIYDKAIGTDVREAPFLPLTNFGAVEAGYPSSSLNLKAKMSMLPLVHPYVSYTHTTFKLGVSPANAAEIGLDVGLNMLNVRAYAGRYTQSGFANRNYAAVGASLNF